MMMLLSLLLASAIVALTPAALASPPDQHWVAGLYDNADYDDVVLAVVESVASLEPQPPHGLTFGQAVVAVVLPPDESPYATPGLSSSPIRAPPTLT
jgi:hypothetical protein